MVEATVAVSLASLTALAAMFSRANTRISDMDSRIDRIEVRVAEKYVPRGELTAALDRMEAHMIRIENKLDQVSLQRN